MSDLKEKLKKLKKNNNENKKVAEKDVTENKNTKLIEKTFLFEDGRQLLMD